MEKIGRFYINFCYSIAIILLSVHLGLNVKFIGNVFKRMLRLTPRVGKLIFVSFSIDMIVISCYSMNSILFRKCLTMLFFYLVAGLN